MYFVDYMYFADEEHLNNYESLVGLYDPKRQGGFGGAFVSALYISAYPGIYRCLVPSKLEELRPPLEYLFASNEWYSHLVREQTKKPHNQYALDTKSRALALAGMSLYNGWEADISAVVTAGDEIFKVFLQACEFRKEENPAKRKTESRIDLSHVEGYQDLTEDEQKLLERVYTAHVYGCMDAEERQGYTPDQIIRVAWDNEDNTVNIYFPKNWWHYKSDGTWY